MKYDNRDNRSESSFSMCVVCVYVCIIIQLMCLIIAVKKTMSIALFTYANVFIVIF